ncbi:MAG: hypothetical protein ACRDZ3_17535, partial [Acidimicrobiia bacterium]
MTTTGLQCPGCGHVHPLAEVAGQERFRCIGCRRLLAVPESVAAPPSAPVVDSDLTRAHPAPVRPGSDGGGRPAPAPRSASGATASAPPGSSAAVSAGAELPAFVRVPVWLRALGLGFAVSAALLRAVGLLDVDAVLDAFAGEGVRRY